MGRAHHRRFLVSPDAIRGGDVDLAVHARQLASVLRLHSGDVISVLDGSGREWTAALTEATPRRARARLLSELSALPEAGPAITLVQVVPRGPAMDVILAKATELGVSRIIPVEAAHSVRRIADRRARWERILREAAEQSGRRTAPEIAEPCALESYLRSRTPGTLLVCHADSSATPVLAACRELAGEAQMACLVGGEGGLAPDELERLRAEGGRLVSLGPLLLRADTAAVALLAVLQAGLQAFGPTAAMSALPHSERMAL